jgi:hypothetical protein
MDLSPLTRISSAAFMINWIHSDEHDWSAFYLFVNSVSDPDTFWSAGSGSVFSMRILIQDGENEQRK